MVEQEDEDHDMFLDSLEITNTVISLCSFKVYIALPIPRCSHKCCFNGAWTNSQVKLGDMVLCIPQETL